MDSKILFGLSILSATYDEVLERIDALMNENRVHVLSDINVANLVLMRKNAIVRKSVLESDIVVPDGLSIVWASMIIGRSLRERIAGCDLFQKLIAFGSTKGYRFYLLGAKQEVVLRVKNVLEARHSSLNIVGIRNGYFGIEDEREIVDEIVKSKASVLILGFSSPKREEFILRNRAKLEGVKYVQGVGGSFDVVAGYVKRAPLWIQQIGFEWLFRLMQEPRRLWKRYLTTNLFFVFLLLKETGLVRFSFLNFLPWKNQSVDNGVS